MKHINPISTWLVLVIILIFNTSHSLANTLPEPAGETLNLSISGLKHCSESNNDHIRLKANLPVIIITHGCFGSAAKFRFLADIFSFHGQQAVCFTYDDRDSLTNSTSALISAVDKLSQYIRKKDITVIGHSMGGLISRKALTSEQLKPFTSSDINFRLVTVSTPYAGISSASICGSKPAIMISLGLMIPICKVVSGDKWHEITSSSDFILRPGDLLDNVEEHVRIITDERGSCRKYNEWGTCIEDDYVFSTEEQYYDPVDRASVVRIIEVKAGHTEIVGDTNNEPLKLIRVLQDKGIMNHTQPWRRTELRALLSKLY